MKCKACIGDVKDGREMVAFGTWIAQRIRLSYSSKNVLPRTRAFAFPIRKRTFLNEHIAIIRTQRKALALSGDA